ncbi:MAG: hypothetical protein AB7U85_06875 [Alphaproteobacteria bacterium]
MKPFLKQKTPFNMIAERDTDLLLLEELCSSPIFCANIVKKLYGPDVAIKKIVGIWHSPDFGYLGNADLLFVFEDNFGYKNALLIENRFDIPRRDLQAQRYFEIGENGFANGLWSHYLTCLFCPEKYFSDLDPADYFGCYLSYEYLASWFDEFDKTKRGQYKSMMLKEAIKQKLESIENRFNVKSKKSFDNYKVFPAGALNIPEGYQVVEKMQATPFWQSYYDFCKSSFPSLSMGDPEKQGRVDLQWAVFKPAFFAKNVLLIHKMPQGFMDLSFSEKTQAEIEQKYSPFLDSDMKIKQSGKNIVIRINVPAVADPQSFVMIKDIINFSLSKANNLCNMYMKVNGS